VRSGGIADVLFRVFIIVCTVAAAAAVVVVVVVAAAAAAIPTGTVPEVLQSPRCAAALRLQ
jgi:hypothetical protein